MVVDDLQGSSTANIENLLTQINNSIMALMQGGLPIQFPASINANVTNTTLAVTGTVATTEAAQSTTGEALVNVTATSQSLSSIPANTKGAQIQYLSSNGNDRLYTRTDGTAATTNDAQTTALQVITLESLLDVQNFRFMGTVGTSIKVIYRG